MSDDEDEEIFIADRFFRKVKKVKNGCWLFTEGKTSKGYGTFCWRGDSILAHRYSWFVHYGKWPEIGICVCHHCDIPNCVHPSHLFLGTKLDNKRDCVRKGRHACGEKNRHAKLTAAQVKKIRKDKRTQKIIALEYGIDDSHVCRIKSGKLWKHL